jgi:hypothetical protein
MASLTPKLLYSGNDTGANAYSVSNTSGNYTIIKSINICNTSGSDKTCSLHILQDANAAAANNKVLSNVTVSANNVLYYNTSLVMPANSKIYVSQSTSDLTFTISGVEYA